MSKHQIKTQLLAKVDLYNFMATHFVQFLYNPNEPDRFFKDLATACISHLFWLSTANDICNSVQELAGVFGVELPGEWRSTLMDMIGKEMHTDSSIFTK